MSASGRRAESRRPSENRSGEARTVPVPGIRAVESLLRHAPARISEILLAGEEQGARARVIQLAERMEIAVHSAKLDRLDELCGEVQHQGICALAKPAEYADWSRLIDTASPLLVALDQVTDPHNFGAILRVAEALGATGALVTSNRCARLGPTVTKTSAGASEILPVAMETNLVQALGAAQARGCQVLGADMEGESLETIDWTQPTVLVIGAEGKGLRRLTRERCDHLVSIPMQGVTESLNASVAAAILLYEAVRQRRSAIKNLGENA